VRSEEQLSVVEEAGVWCLRGSAVDEVGLVNEFLAYLANRNFSPRTCRAYAYDLLAFMRWLVAEGLASSDVDVDVMPVLTACREATPRGRPGGNVAGAAAVPYALVWGSHCAATLRRRLVRRRLVRRRLVRRRLVRRRTYTKKRDGADEVVVPHAFGA
jgi:hypothetical protein